MKYTTRSNNNRMEYHITEGNAYIAFVTMGGSGFRVDEVKEGETWYEGVGEEVCIVADSEDAAYDYIRSVYDKDHIPIHLTRGVDDSAMDMSKCIVRFIEPQKTSYTIALEEVRNGRKLSHWMWYIFPQLRGLGQSTLAWYYGIEDLCEATAYLAHPVLGHRLREITQTALDISETDPLKVFGWPDNMKFRSCMTLFAQVSEDDLFTRVLEKFFSGQEDQMTLELLKQKEYDDTVFKSFQE